jgi:HEAT repeat protein
MKTSVNAKFGPAPAGLALLLILTAGAASQTTAAPSFLSGKVSAWDQAGRSLQTKVESAAADFESKKQGDFFFIAYMFPSRHKIRHHGCYGPDGPFEVVNRGGEIKFDHSSRGESWETEDGKAPAGLLALCSTAKDRPRAEDFRLIDPEETYEFKTLPVYWLGNVPVEDSLDFIEKEFEAGGADHVRESSLFAVSAHDSPKAYDFLMAVALGSYRSEVRKNAVFWIGESHDPRTVADLKSILAKSGDDEVREQVVFALSLNGSREAVEELLHIAKNGSDHELRKKAIFWLGQKASEESVRGLKEIVEGPDEDVKESAVFAISQLPKQKSVPMLIGIAKENKSPSVRKKALFWLGQTGSDEAIKLFEEILLKKD